MYINACKWKKILWLRISWEFFFLCLFRVNWYFLKLFFCLHAIRCDLFMYHYFNIFGWIFKKSFEHYCIKGLQSCSSHQILRFKRYMYYEYNYDSAIYFSYTCLSISIVIIFTISISICTCIIPVPKQFDRFVLHIYIKNSCLKIPTWISLEMCENFISVCSQLILLIFCISIYLSLLYFTYPQGMWEECIKETIHSLIRI